MNPDLLDELLEEIEDERVVVLLGPDFVRSEERSLVEQVHGVVREQKAAQIQYYYPNDNLFLFQSDRDKERVRREMRRVYKSFDYPEAPYRQVLELPVPLILSLNPDTFLTDLATRLGLQHDFSHFRFTGEAPDEVQEPTRHRPLIYNLFGSRTEDESLVLNYEDLFNLLKAILPNGLPDKIRAKLKKASHFLFLGCDFEKWYTQVILQLLTGERKGRPKFALKSRMQAGPARDFLVHQFKIEFLDPEHAFFDQLYEALKERGMLRTLLLPATDQTGDAQAIRALVADGKVKDAIRQTRALLRLPRQVDAWTSLSNGYRTHEDKKNGGLYLPGEAEAMEARLVHDLLDLLNQVA